MHILNLVRWKNLSILLCSALLIRFALLPGFGATIEMDLFAYSLLTLSIICVTAGGNVINDFFDITTDSINKPQRLIVDNHLSRSTALVVYAVLNLIGIGSAFYLLLAQHVDQFIIIFYILITSPLLLIAYSIWLKKYALIGNLLVSLLVALSIYCLGSALIDTSNNPVILFTIGVYSCLALVLNMSRELIKDIEDIKGDHYCNMKTLPILIGKKRCNYVVFGLLTLSILILLSIVLAYFLTLNLLIFYVFVLVILPLILISRKVLDASKERDYKSISFHLKLVFLAGLCSMLTFLAL